MLYLIGLSKALWLTYVRIMFWSLPQINCRILTQIRKASDRSLQAFRCCEVIWIWILGLLWDIADCRFWSELAWGKNYPLGVRICASFARTVNICLPNFWQLLASEKARRQNCASLLLLSSPSEYRAAYRGRVYSKQLGVRYPSWFPIWWGVPRWHPLAFLR